MNELTEKLLQPVSAEQPCGPDLYYNPLFEELETILKGKPEVEMGSEKRPAEPPDWPKLKAKATEFLGKSKHLRAATMLCCSLLKTDGLVGFRDGVQLILGLLERYWPTLYPLLDPTDKNDPTQRLNILSALTAPRGSFMTTGWLGVVDSLYAAGICQPKGAPPVTFDQIQAATRKETPGGGAAAGSPEAARLEAVFREAAGEQAATQHKALQDALTAVQGIEHFLTAKLGAANTISFDNLTKTLQEMLAGLQRYLPTSAAEGGAAAQATGGADKASSAGATGVQVRVGIGSREDVVRAIDAICDYYRKVERSSPVPYLLRRAQKLAMMDFVQAVGELKLATVEQLRPSMGSAVDSGPGAGEKTRA
jgi:type VI secretion system protein ImpA